MELRGTANDTLLTAGCFLKLLHKALVSKIMFCIVDHPFHFHSVRGDSKDSIRGVKNEITMNVVPGLDVL
jgi:hypothetical protein